MPTARRHHYLPQAYLAGFTESGTIEGRCCVLEVQTGKRFVASPKNLAVERDFNRIEIEGEQPDALEQAFSELEGHAAAAIRRASDTGAFPQGEDYDNIINLIVLIALRNPQMRESWNRAKEQQARLFAELLVSQRTIFDHLVAQVREAGHLSEEVSQVPYEEVKRFIKDGQYDIACPRAGNQIVELQAFDSLLKLFARRLWSVCIAPSDGPEFVCSDHPVTLRWKEPGMRAPIGFGLANTELCVPLSRKIGLYGVFEEELPPAVHLTEQGVAEFNHRVAANASRHVFSATETFVLILDGEVTESSAVFGEPSGTIPSRNPARYGGSP
jgi:hypothetical protein